MLILGHIALTVVPIAAVEKRLPKVGCIDYRIVAMMSIAPDIIDRTLFLFILPGAISGRLLAHTLAFQLVFFAVIVFIRRRWWIYGLASAGHLLFDSIRPSITWIRHLVWPFMGSDLRIVNVMPAADNFTGPYFSGLWLRIIEGSNPYLHGSQLAWSLEVAALILLVSWGFSRSLHLRENLVRFLTTGKI